MAKKKRQPIHVDNVAGTEKDWLSARDPRDLLGQLFWLDEQARFHSSERKWVLFQVACLRRVQHLFRDGRSCKAIDDSEEYAEGLITHEELFQRGSRAVNPQNPDNLSEVPKEACSTDQLRVSYAWDALASAGPQAHGIYKCQDYQEGSESVTFSGAQTFVDPRAEGEAQARLLRDIFGNPFRPVVADADWFARNDSAAVKLAQAIYERREFGLLPILGDALEDAGCWDEEILKHCRRPAEHVLGCWVLDLVLAKE